METKCPSTGAVRLKTKRGDEFWLPTTCKMWQCRICRKALAAYIKARIIYGLTHSMGSLFITITYVMDGPESLRDAPSVARDLNNLWKKLKKRSRWKNLSYVKVPEVTAQGQVHLHVIATNVDFGKASCRKYGELMTEMKDRGCKTQCVQHELMELWEEITGDSWVVDASQVRSAERSASYVTKYVVKGFHDRQALEALGFKRRYAISRTWPSVGRMRLAFSEQPGWHQIDLVPGKFLGRLEPQTRELVLGGGDIVPRIGENVVDLVFGAVETRKLKAALRKVKDGTPTIPHTV